MSAVIIVEAIAFSVVCGASFAATRFIRFKKLDRNLSVHDTNNLLIAIPCAAYIAYRLYFGLVRQIAKKIPEYAYLRTLSNIVLLVLGIAIPFYFEKVRSLFQGLITYILSEIPPPLVDSASVEIFKGLEFGKKVAILIFGWFLLLFIVELVLRLVLGGLALIGRVVFGTHKQGKGSNQKGNRGMSSGNNGYGGVALGAGGGERIVDEVVVAVESGEGEEVASQEEGSGGDEDDEEENSTL